MGKYNSTNVIPRCQARLRKTINYKKIMGLQTHPDTPPFNKEKKLRFIKDLHNHHSGKEIWVLGCGPSLDDFPASFFNNKITIVMSWGLLEFPHSTHWMTDVPGLLFYRDYHPEVFRKTIVMYPLKKDQIKINKGMFQVLLGRYYFDPIRVGSRRSDGLFRERANNAIKASLDSQLPFSVVYYGTGLHRAILVAAYLGARRITLAGAEHEVKGDQHHAKRGLLKDVYYYRKAPSQARYDQMKKGTQILSRLLSQHGIRMQRYFYDKGYVDII